MLALLSAATGSATPANKAALERHYEQFLGAGLNRCSTCHLPSEVKNPEKLADFPHNPFGDRLRALGEELEKSGQRKDLATRLGLIAQEDSDGDGSENEAELLAATNPGDDKQAPPVEQAAEIATRRDALKTFLTAYRWQPFERVQRPSVPANRDTDWSRNAVDAFIASEHEARGLKPRPEAAKAILLRRVYLDLIGLSPTPAEQRAFADDASADAYEKVVDRLLADPRHGERWGRHWMDVWRYSDWAGWTDGKQVRDSQRHIWRWRDWIVEALNADKGYDRMVTEMLAGDELAPADPETLRATGFLVRNYKMLSREQWLEDTVKHTAQAFMGITLGCAKCHDHRADPISQAEYYQVRAIFEPHQVRTDRVPGELDREKNGLPRVYDVEKDAPTYLLIRGDERTPDKERVIAPAVPRALSGDRLKAALESVPVKLPREAASPDRREFVVKELLAASDRNVAKAREALNKAGAEPLARILELAIAAEATEAGHAALLAELRAEQLEVDGKKETQDWKGAAKEAMRQQAVAARTDAELALRKAQAAETLAVTTKKDIEAATKKRTEAAQALAKAEEQARMEPTISYKPRAKEEYPSVSTGRRLAFAKWLANADNPLAARVAVNHLWLRHFGRGIVTTPENFGTNGARPSHPALLDWLAAEFMAGGWRMKPIHRLIVTSSTYRMASTPEEANATIDPDNIHLWRMPTRRMEAELVRDNLLHVAGTLDEARGGPEIPESEGLTSKRRSIYLQSAAEKEVEFLKIFDGPSVNECYQRHPSVMPQQSLALANSELTQTQARVLAKRLTDGGAIDDEAFVSAAFERVLARISTAEERRTCLEFLGGNPPVEPIGKAPSSNSARARENLLLVLFNHHDFVTIR
ncbi:MAG TPA: DUF1553 domain-containing protein [Chthoniobacteraceae bacterium]|nr:DUF1553 domain-containing protein [Chthoniobacteraceae bacterium]